MRARMCVGWLASQLAFDFVDGRDTPGRPKVPALRRGGRSVPLRTRSLGMALALLAGEKSDYRGRDT